MITCNGTYFKNHNEEEVTVMLVEDFISIGRQLPGYGQVIRWPMQEVQIQYERNRDTSVITCNTDAGARLVIAGSEAQQYIEKAKISLAKPWYRQDKNANRVRLITFFVSAAAILALAYFFIIPWLAGKMAGVVSPETEEKFGNAAYESLVNENAIDTAATRKLNEFFDAMNIHSLYDIRITAVKGKEVNAFALPGGHIVVYSALLDRLAAYPQLAALLSHEFVHVRNRHSTSTIFSHLGSRIFLSLVTGNSEGAAGVIAGQAEKLRSLSYSRGKEQEADVEGLDILLKRGISSTGFLELFQILKRSESGAMMPQILSSHPDLDSRINNIRKAAAGKSAVDDPVLKTIFDQLKNK